jgi:hypothetical protein
MAYLLVMVHASKSTRMACLAALASDLSNFFLGSIGKIAWVWICIHGHLILDCGYFDMFQCLKLKYLLFCVDISEKLLNCTVDSRRRKHCLYLAILRTLAVASGLR